MAYRSLKNVLGETSLERKCRFLFGLCLFVLIAGSFWWYGSRTEQIVYATTRNTGRQLVDAYMLQYHWQKLEPEQKYTDLIRRLASDLGNRTFDASQLLRPDAAASFVRRARTLVAAGRPPCPFCLQPLDPDGHVCPRANGYRRRV